MYVSYLLNNAVYGGNMFGRNLSIEEYYAKNPWLRLAISTISDSMSSVEWNLYKKKRNGEREIVLDHEFLDLFSTWNPILKSGKACRYVFQAWKEMKGTSFILLERQGKSIKYMYPILQDDISEYPNSDNHYRYTVKIGDEEWSIPYEDILCMKYPDPNSIYGEGQGTASSLLDEIFIEETSGEIIASHLKNGAIPPYIIGMNTDEDTGKAFKKKWETEHTGPANRGKPLFAGTSEIKALKLMDSFKDLGLLEVRSHEAEVIRQVYKIPPELIGKLENSNRATIEAAEQIYCKMVLLPKLEYEKEFWNNNLIKPLYGKEYELDFVDPSPEDKEYKLQVMEKAPSLAFELNDWREAAGYERLKELEGKYQMSFNESLYDIKELLEEKEKEKTEKMVDDVLEQFFRKETKQLQIQEVLDAIKEQTVFDITSNEYKSLISTVATETLKELNLDIEFVTNERVTNYIKTEAGKRIKNIVSTLKKSLKKELSEGVKEGEGTGELKKRLKKVFKEKKTDYELSRIVRTETMSANNFASLEAYQQGGIKEKEWISTRDKSTRDTHFAMDRKKIKVDEYFDIEGDKGLAPGSFNEAKNNVHCRCVIAPIVSKKSLFDSEKKILSYWEKKSLSAERFESKFEKVFIKAFNALEKSALEVFDA